KPDFLTQNSMYLHYFIFDFEIFVAIFIVLIVYTTFCFMSFVLLDLNLRFVIFKRLDFALKFRILISWLAKSCVGSTLEDEVLNFSCTILSCHFCLYGITTQDILSVHNITAKKKQKTVGRLCCLRKKSYSLNYS
ncbi:hypothetical protein ACJX0J_018962, partial [Zea mays]